jgi:hypothetical protein
MLGNIQQDAVKTGQRDQLLQLLSKNEDDY